MTLLKLFRHQFRHPRYTRVDDHLLTDIGLSRVEIEYCRGQATGEERSLEPLQQAEAAS